MSLRKMELKLDDKHLPAPSPAFPSQEWIPSRLPVRLSVPFPEHVRECTQLYSQESATRARASAQKCSSSANGTCPHATNILAREPTQKRTRQSEWVVSFGKGRETTKGQPSPYVF